MEIDLKILKQLSKKQVLRNSNMDLHENEYLEVQVILQNKRLEK